MIQILHISDTHLGSRRYSLDSREQDVYDAFNQLIDIAIREHVKAIVHTGDLFDVYHPQVTSIKVAIDALNKIKDKIPFISIPGDHDTPKRKGYIYPQRLLSESLNLVTFLSDGECIEIKDQVKLSICGIRHIPTVSAQILKDKLKSIKPSAERNVLMLHQGLKKKLPYDGSWQIEEGDLPQGFQYIALGHFHTRFKEILPDGGILSIAGSPEIIRDEEIEGYEKYGKGAYLVDLSQKQPDIQPINLNIRPQEIFNINTNSIDSDLEDLVKKCSSYSKKPIIHIVLQGERIEKTTLFKKLRVLQDITEYYRIARDETTWGNIDISVKSSSSVNQLIRDYLKQRGYNDQEMDLIVEMINHYDEEEIVNPLLVKLVGLDENRRS
ncbi:2-hydroxyacid dehydrogenase [Candidatus Acidianus copahuensis]|uniref:DNA double-strand break repair protein Mre11 n=1 Tax=Candidatus Acidianus copahuensis TaxID=1160895 RepID=A0A031LJJ1_9CREN|nr:2-hydroxyacid dehydrogenase [Candidatus Acidianus copahuensis]NON61450.1 exonuclease SbcCD subunit D [Acidianus sp. RZ1]